MHNLSETDFIDIFESEWVVFGFSLNEDFIVLDR